MSDRFITLFQLPENQYASGAPMIISAGVLLEDTETGNLVAQLKFKNLSEKIVVEVALGISLCDLAGNSMETMMHRYSNLRVGQNEFIGQGKAILVPNKTARSFVLHNLTVIFNDQSIWEWNLKTSSPFFQLPMLDTLTDALKDPDLVDQYRREVNREAMYVPQELGDIWLCSCGTVNRYEKCNCCHTEKSVVFHAYDVTLLEEGHREYLKKERIRKAEAQKQWQAEQEIRIQQEKEEENIKLAKETEKKRKVRLSLLIILAVIVVLFLAFLWINHNVIAPGKEYRRAQQLLESDNFSEAAEAFTQLGNYKDSREMVEESKYRKASKLFSQKRFEEAAKEFSELGQYEDSAEMVKESKYQKALILIIDNEFQSASEMLTELGDYKDSQTLQEKYTYLSENRYLNGLFYYQGEYLAELVGFNLKQFNQSYHADYVSDNTIQLTEGSNTTGVNITLNDLDTKENAYKQIVVDREYTEGDSGLFVVGVVILVGLVDDYSVSDTQTMLSEMTEQLRKSLEGSRQRIAETTKTRNGISYSLYVSNDQMTFTIKGDPRGNTANTIQINNWTVIDEDSYEGTISSDKTEPFVAVIGNDYGDDVVATPTFVYMKGGNGILQSYLPNKDPISFFTPIGILPGVPIDQSSIKNITYEITDYRQDAFSTNWCTLNLHIKLNNRENGLLFFEFTDDFSHDTKMNQHVVVLDGRANLTYTLKAPSSKLKKVGVTVDPRYFCSSSELKKDEFVIDNNFSIEKDTSSFSTRFSGKGELSFPDKPDGLVLFTKELTAGGRESNRGVLEGGIAYLKDNHCAIRTFDSFDTTEKIRSVNYDIQIVGFMSWEEIE